MNAGEKNIKTFIYVSVISKTCESAPSKDVILPDKNKPEKTNIAAKKMPAYNVFTKILSALFCSPLLFKTVYFVAAPIPSISPQP